MSNQVTFKCYNAISIAMKRDKIASYGVIATTLLECFLHNDGELRASLVKERKICKEGEFTEWREALIAKGWLSYSHGSYARHTPGPKLVKYINKEKMISQELATVRQVQIVDKKVEAMQEEISLLKAAVKNMIEEFDPPVTDEKIQRRLKVVHEK